MKSNSEKNALNQNEPIRIFLACSSVSATATAWAYLKFATTERIETVVTKRPIVLNSSGVYILPRIGCSKIGIALATPTPKIEMTEFLAYSDFGNNRFINQFLVSSVARKPGFLLKKIKSIMPFRYPNP